MVFDSNYVPASGCITINKNVSYNYTPVAGSAVCLYLEVGENTITEFFAVNQTANRQVVLTALDDPSANHSFVRINQSADVDSDDNVQFFSEPGHYYAYLVASSGDGGSIHIGAAVNANGVDILEDISTTPSYTGNDVSPYTFPNGVLSDYYPYLHNSTDVDLYKLQSFWGQDLSLRITPQVGQRAEFIAEILLNGQWVNLAFDNLYIIGGLAPFSEILLRVRASDPTQILTSGFYLLEAGSRAVQIVDETPDGENVARITGGSDYARVQNLNTFKWQITVLDSTGNAVRGVRTRIRYSTEARPATEYGSWSITDYFGVGETDESLRSCTGSRAYPNAAASPHIRYNKGFYKFEVAPAHYNSDPVLTTKYVKWINLCSDYQSYP